jgi:hypothetical protein
MNKLFGNLEEFGAEPQQEKKQTATPEKIVKADEYVLVIVNADYADEFDVCHSYVMTKSEYDQGVETSKKNLEGKRHVEIWFGTNEGIDVSGFDDYMRNISVQSITKEDYDAYMRMFGGEFGMISHYFPFGEDY